MINPLALISGLRYAYFIDGFWSAFGV